MSEHEENLAKLRAAADQMKEGIKEIAQTLAIYYKELKANEFTDEEAFALTMAWQNQMIASYQPPNDD